MNEKELMIGDWVQVRGCTAPTKVVGITANKIHHLWADGVKHSKDSYYFEPIPLTEEMLERNGLRDFETRSTLFHASTFKITRSNQGYLYNMMRFSDKRYGMMMSEVPMVYVHELQHALRLCGLNELADNFKV